MPDEHPTPPGPGSVPPPRRVYAPRTYQKEVDAADRVMRLRAGVFAVGTGAIAGPIWGAVIGGVYGGNTLLWVAGFTLGVGFGVYYLAIRVTMGGVKTAEQVYNPSGDSTPYRTDYSRAQSLLVQGKYEEAAQAYEVACLESRWDPEPYFRLARLYRDHLQRHEDALAWLQRARTDAEVTSGQELLAMQEIIEIYAKKLRTPRKAIPELVGLCERFPGTPAADTAAAELTEMRDMLARERDGLEPFTAQYLKKRGRLREDD